MGEWSVHWELKSNTRLLLKSGADWITDEPDTKRLSEIEECKTARSAAERTRLERRKRGRGRAKKLLDKVISYLLPDLRLSTATLLYLTFFLRFLVDLHIHLYTFFERGGG